MSVKDQIISNRDTVTATIAAGTSVSGAVKLGGLRLFRFNMPDAWTAAGITYQVSDDEGATWRDLYSGATEVATVASAGKSQLVEDPVQFSSISMIRLRSGTGAAPVAQAADRVITLILRGV